MTIRSIYRTATAAILALLALGAVASASAEAAPEWFHAGQVISHNIAFTSSGGKVKLRIVASGSRFECTSNRSSGELEKPDREKHVIDVFTGCVGINLKKEECTMHSVGAAKEGEIVTAPLKGELGQVAHEEATSEVGLALEEESGGKEFAKIEGSCFGGGVSLAGRIAGEVAPTHSELTSGELVFAATESRQMIHNITLGGKKESLVMTLAGQETTMANTMKVTFGEAVEVT
jgi:hypothetical protein